MRVLFVTHYFPPEVGATQTRLADVTSSLARRGHQVTVLAPLPHYPSGIVPAEYRRRAFARERRGAVLVVRTWVYAVPNRRVVKRLLDYASFAVAAMPAAALAGPFDVLFAETPPLFPGLAAAAIAGSKRRPYVCNVADLWVDSAVEVGALRGRPAIAAARAAERAVLRRAARVTAVTEGVRRAVVARGVHPDLVELIPNGVDAAVFRPEARPPRPTDAPFTVLYAGNHGLAQGLASVLEAARLLRNAGVRFLLVGDGAEKHRLVTLARQGRIENVEFVDPQPLAEIPRVLAAADACVVPLRALTVLRGAVPSKLFEAMAAARPVIVAAEGEAAALVERAGAGLCVAPESPRALADAVLRLRDDPDLGRRLGESGRRYVLAHHSRERLVDAYERVLEAACAGSPASS